MRVGGILKLRDSKAFVWEYEAHQDTRNTIDQWKRNVFMFEEKLGSKYQTPYSHP